MTYGTFAVTTARQASGNGRARSSLRRRDFGRSNIPGAMVCGEDDGTSAVATNATPIAKGEQLPRHNPFVQPIDLIQLLNGRI